MKIGNDKKKVIDYISKCNNDKLLEFECRLTKNISQTDFHNILKRVKGMPNVKYIGSQESLDIFYQYQKDKISNIRVSVNGNESIKRYCKSNDIKNINNIDFVRKSLYVSKGEKNYPIDINNYNIRFNLKKETPLNKSSQEVKSIYGPWKQTLKEFRYKKRFSYNTLDGKFRFDFTIVRKGDQEKIIGPVQRMKKSQVRPNQVKFIKSPEYVNDFKTYYENLGDDDIVELKGRINYRTKPHKTVKDAKIFETPFHYEVEIEYLGNKKDEIPDIEETYNGMISYIGTLLQSLQKSYVIISEEEKRKVLEEYRLLMDAGIFKGPHNVTLELKHIAPKRYEDYNNILNIRRDYSVTDKADGERNLLIVLEDGSLYLMNRKNVIKSLGAKIPSLSKSILDGEYITKSKDNKNINLFMVFDVYFINNEDVRDRHFSKKADTYDNSKTRHEIMKEKLDNLDIEKAEKSLLDVKLKKFYYSDLNEYDETIDKKITELEKEMLLLEVGGANYNTLKSNIATLKKDTKIFTEASKVYNKQYIYHIDGLIFTPIFKGVGETENRTSFDGRWNYSFKWKPSEENTIDFMVKVVKEDGVDQIEYSNDNGEFKTYKTINLLVGYNPLIHTKHNSCRILNEEVSYEEKYTYVPFIPTNPYRKESSYAYIKLDVNGNMRTTDKNIITDGCIIECKYDQTKNDGFRWIPIRVRDTNKPNDFTTAKNVWNTIFYPITKDMIVTGNMDQAEFNDEVYYTKNMKRTDITTKAMNDFHSYVKKSIIVDNSKEGQNILDISCGRGGDLNHWLDTRFNLVIGIDLNRDNLENMNGACNRVLNQYDDVKEKINDLLFIWGDSSLDFTNGEAGKDELNKYYLDIIYGNVLESSIKNEKLKRLHDVGNITNGNGFDVVSCQFSFHYFFESLEKLERVLLNISNSLKTGGVFIGTTLDGKQVFDELSRNSTISEYKDGNLLWKITKKYDNEEFNSTETSLGYKVDVYMDSIGRTNTEYLVNYDFLETLLVRFNLRLKDLTSFSNKFSELNKKQEKYGDALSMNDQLKKYSFLNKCFVIEKI